MHTFKSNYIHHILYSDEPKPDPVLELIKSIISDLENSIKLGNICHLEATEKYLEMITRKKLLEEALIRCEGRAEFVGPEEPQLRDLWLRNGEV